MPKWRYLVGALIVFSLAIFLRFYRLGAVPVSLYWDETAILVDARAIAETGRDMYSHSWLQAIFPSYGDYKLPVYIWLASITVKFFGVSEWAVRLPSALAGVLTLIVGGLLANELLVKPKKGQLNWLFLITALVIAIAPWSIIFSRTGFEGHVGQFLLAMSIYLALKAKKNWGWAIASALLGGLATYTYFSIRFVWPVVFIAGTILLTGRKTWRSLVLGLLLPLLVYGVSLWPMVNSPLYADSNQFRLSATSVLNMADWPILANQYRIEVGNTPFDKLVYHPLVLQTRELVSNYSDNLSANFLFFTGDPNLRHGTGRHGLFLWPFLIPFVYGWYALFNKHWRQASLLLIWWLLALLPASVPETTPHALRTMNALVPLSIVIAFGTWQGWQAIWSQAKLKLLKRGLLLGWLVIVGLSLVDFSRYYFNVYPKLSAQDWQDGYKAVAHEAWANRQSVDVVWIEPFDSRFYLWLMAYEVPVDEYKQIEFENYLPPAIGNIRFRWFDWAKLPTLSEKTVLIAKKDYIDWNLESVPYKPRWYKTFLRTDGVAEFAAIYFEREE